MQQRGKNSPTGIQLVITNKVGMVTLQSIQDQSLIRLGDLEITEATPIGKIKLSHGRLHTKTRKLGVHLDVDTLVGLDADDKLITRNVLENSAGNILELNSNFRLLFIQSFLEDCR